MPPLFPIRERADTTILMSLLMPRCRRAIRYIRLLMSADVAGALALLFTLRASDMSARTRLLITVYRHR